MSLPPFAAYTVPNLMRIQYVLMRLVPWGRPVRLRNGYVVRIMPKGHGVEVRPWWPGWLIRASHSLSLWWYR